MKTYIAYTGKGKVATQAKSRMEAWDKMTEKGFVLNKGCVMISCVDISILKGFEIV